MAPKGGKGGGGSSKGGSGGSSSNYSYHVPNVNLSPYWGNLAFLVITGIALAAMLPQLIAMFKIKTKKTHYNLNAKGFIKLKWAIFLATWYVLSSITQTPSG